MKKLQVACSLAQSTSAELLWCYPPYGHKHAAAHNVAILLCRCLPW